METLLCASCGRANSEFDSRCAFCGAALSDPASATKVEGTPLRPVASEDETLSSEQISHFRILGRIGSGGMGTVFRALDLELNREVALKFLHARREGQPHDQARLRREAQAAAALDHPNIGTIYEVGESEGRQFIAMALYDGETLAERLARQPARRLALSEAVAIAGQLASALEAAHAAGLVHRDLKPGNVMILRDGRVKLIDFGLARRADSPRLTEQGFAWGTAAYMAPEQLRSQEGGPAADLWALGVVLYEMLAGRHPFGGERQGMVHSILFESPFALRESCPEVPLVIERVVARCLAKEPRGRPSAGAVAADLQASGLWANSGSGAAIPSPRRRIWQAWGVAGAVVALLAVATTAFFLTRKPAPTVYVAVLKPVIAGSLGADERALVGGNLQASSLRALAALEGLAAIDPAQVNAVSGTTVQVARAVAAAEVLSTTADCGDDICMIDLRRLSGADGRVLWSEVLRLPPSRPRLLADATAAAVRQGYPDRKLRFPRLELEVSEEDYKAFLDLRRRTADPREYPKLLDELGALRQRAPGFIEAYSLEANIARRLYLTSGDSRYLERGLHAARLARDRSPSDPRPLASLFDLCLDSGRFPEAEAALAQLEQVDPAASLLRRGQLAERQGHPREALTLMASAVRLQPSSSTLLILANAEYRQGRLDDARNHYKQLLRRSPGNLQALQGLAQSELLQRPERAIDPLREIVRRAPGADSLSNLGVALLLQRRYSEAETSLRRALELQPGSLPASLNLADCLALLGRDKEARALYTRIAGSAERSATPGDSETLAIEAQALAHLGDPNRAVEMIQQALRLTPDNAQLAYEAAVVYVLVGERELRSVPCPPGRGGRRRRLLVRAACLRSFAVQGRVSEPC